jgi:hypothetical protein
VPHQLKVIGRSLAGWGMSRPSTRQSGWVWTISAVVLALCVLLVSLGASNHQRHEHGFDVLDEGAHYDYVVRLAQGHLPRSGDPLTQETLRMMSCLGASGVPAHGCAAEHRNPATTAPAGGYSYEAVQQPPLGYLPYLLTIQTEGSSQQALESARWGGFIWSVVGAGLLVWVAWMLELSLIELVAVLAICLLSPIETHSIATVTNDSAGMPAGVATVATYLVSRRRKKPMIVAGLVVGLIVGFMKGLFVVAPLVVLAALVFADIAHRRRPTRADIWVRYGCSAAMLVGAVVSYAAWFLMQSARASVPPSTVLHALEGFATTSHLRATTILLGIQNELSDLSAYVSAPLYWIWDLAIYGCLVGLLVLKGPVGRISQRAGAAALLFGIVALGVAFPLLNFIEGHYDFYTPQRYALPLLPIIALVVVRAMRTRGVLLVGIALPALAVVDQLVTGQF